MPAAFEPGINDLQTRFPEVAVQADGWDPSMVSFGSKKKLQWKCDKGHTWLASPNQRCNGNKVRGCPYCANKLVWKTFNDLESLFPEIALEADGWDPSCVTFGTTEVKDWKCALGHTWKSKVVYRTHGDQKQGCPYCANQKVWPGFNDLKSQFPAIAKEAFGWDPSIVSKASGKKKSWKCPEGHTYEMTVCNRTLQGQNCPICSNKKTVPGINDLKTLQPDLALEAFGWDPSTLSPGSNASKRWVCGRGHVWMAQVYERSVNKTGCPYCKNTKVLPGFNDLETKFPSIAAEADGWDPKNVLAGSQKKLGWRCSQGHKWSVAPAYRIKNNTSCPICANHILVTGENDLATMQPDVAIQADGWDPATVLFGSSDLRDWICNKGHTWKARIADRISRDGCEGTGCPACAKTGFNPGKDAWFYLMSRPGEQQFGITNKLKRRMTTHERNGWTLLEVVGPADGKLVFETEQALKRWLRKTYGVLPGSTENWSTVDFEVQSLSELKAISDISSDLF